MKFKYKKVLGIYVMVCVIILIWLSQSTNAWNNMPVHKNIGLPEDLYNYHFTYLSLDENPNDEEKSDYGTHDWIADGALRLLYDEDPNAWKWLLHDKSDNEPDMTFIANDNYRDASNKHNTVRSYIYFLLATQWPDFKSAPQPLIIEDEKESIANGQHNLGSWIGEQKYQTYHYNVFEYENGIIYFVPKTPDYHNGPHQKAPHYARLMGELAIDYLAKKDIDGNDKRTKVETGSFYIGCMSHYIADLSCPPHLLWEQDGWYSISPKYHTWIENQLAKFTYWDNDEAGPYKGVFEINPAEIIDKGTIEPLPPGIAATLCAINALEIAFGDIDEDKGLLISDEFNEVLTSTHAFYWEWVEGDRENPLLVHPDYEEGITKEHYLDNVEKLLNIGVYYTACAMKYIKQEVDKRGGMDPDDIALSPLPQDALPTEIPERESFPKEKTKEYYEVGKGKIFLVLSISAPLMAGLFAPKIIKTLKEKEIILKNS